LVNDPVEPGRISLDIEPVLARANDPLIEDHLWYHRGVGLLYKGKSKEAADYFNDIIVIHPESVYYKDAQLKLAEAFIAQGLHGEAQKWLRQYLRNEQNRYEAFEARVMLGKSMIDSGDSSGAIEHFKWMTTSATEDATLEQVVIFYGELDRRFGTNMNSWFNQPSVQYRIAESFYESSQWDQAARRVEDKILSKNPSSELKRNAQFLYAKSLARIHRYSEAIEIFEKLRKEGGHYPGLSYWLARTYAKMNRFDKAIAIRRSMVKHYGRSRSAANFAAKIAFLYVDQGKYKQGLKGWEEVLNMKPRGKLLYKTKWYIAWCHYRLGNYDKAVTGFDWILKNKKQAKRFRYRDRARYWKARALVQAGQKAEARSILRKLAARSDYYGILARRRQSGDGRTNKNFARVPGNSSKEYRGSLDLPPPEEVKGQSLHLARALRLNELELENETAREIRAVEKSLNGVDPAVLLELARNNHVYDVARRVALRNYRGTFKRFPKGGGFDRYVWDRAYPEAYPHFVKKRTNNSSVDDDLVWSVMKAESNFRPHVVSPAGAVGLMQIMPSTARRLLDGASAKEFDSRRLFEPEVNINLGVAYISKLWNYFPEDHVSIIASYNAGEEAAGRWLENKNDLAKKDIEVYVEEIPYDETCLYVKRVMSNYWTMQRLYD
jgi:soluble lytic murein transglycosylase